MIKCQVCGYENTDSSEFCLNCGSKLEKSAAAQEYDDLSGEATIVLGSPRIPSTPEAPQAPPPPVSAPPPVAPAPPVAASAPQAPPPPIPQFSAAPPSPPSGVPPIPTSNQFSSMPSGPPPELPSFGSYLALSIIEILCCCLPLGVVGLVFTIGANNKATAGDYQGAAEQYAAAKKWLMIGFILGLVCNGIVVVLQVLGVVMGGGSGGY